MNDAGTPVTRAEFRERVYRRPILVAPGAYDALTAKLVEHSGFETVYVSGAGVSYSTLGQPDVGLVSFGEMVESVRRVASAVSIPIIADADNGYGNPLNVRRTVQAYELAGAYAIQIEDQAWPKKCGHLADKVILPKDEAVMKVKAAVEARQDPNTMIVARTDALAVTGLEDALDRALRYEEAGADVIFVEAPLSPEQMQKICEGVSVPCLANMVEGGRTPLLSNTELQDIGYGLVIYPNMLTRIIARQASDGLHHLKLHGTSRELIPKMMLFNELNELLGMEAITNLQQQYAVDGVPTK